MKDFSFYLTKILPGYFYFYSSTRSLLIPSELSVFNIDVLGAEKIGKRNDLYDFNKGQNVVAK